MGLSNPVGFWVLLEQKLRFELESWNGLIGISTQCTCTFSITTRGESASVKKVRGIEKLTLDVDMKVGHLSQQVGAKKIEI